MILGCCRGRCTSCAGICLFAARSVTRQSKGVGLQLSRHAADAQCDQRKLYLVIGLACREPPAAPAAQVLTPARFRFGGSFPAQRVKTASSFFVTLAISFPVGSLGEEFGWRGVMAPYLNALIDQRLGNGKFWKWTPLLQSLVTGVFWAVRAPGLRALVCCLTEFAVLQVWHVPGFYVDAASQRKCNFWQFLMQEPMLVPSTPPPLPPGPRPASPFAPAIGQNFANDA